MKKFHLIVLALILMSAFIFGCSGGSQNPITPDENKQVADATNKSMMMGLWQVVIDKNTGSVDITRLRQLEAMINVIGFLEPPPLGNMTIDFDTLVIDFDNNLVAADVILSHPIDDAVFMGFDVRGIVFGPELTNADGCTPAMSPLNFEGEPFGYTDGLLGVSNSSANFNDEVNGYKYFADGLK